MQAASDDGHLRQDGPAPMSIDVGRQCRDKSFSRSRRRRACSQECQNSTSRHPTQQVAVYICERVLGNSVGRVAPWQLKATLFRSYRGSLGRGASECYGLNGTGTVSEPSSAGRWLRRTVDRLGGGHPSQSWGVPRPLGCQGLSRLGHVEPREVDLLSKTSGGRNKCFPRNAGASLLGSRCTWGHCPPTMRRPCGSWRASPGAACEGVRDEM